MPKYARTALLLLVVGAFVILGSSQFGWGDSYRLMGVLFFGMGGGILMGRRIKD